MDFKIARQNMVRNQILKRGIKKERVIRAFLEIPRHMFVDTAFKMQAYSDNALPIAASQTISQPYMVALMTEKLNVDPSDRVLEIGTGSGYQAAIMSKICKWIYTIERFEELSIKAKKTIENLDIKNISFKTGDGTCGWIENAPFNKIIVTAGAPSVPEKLFDQLEENGKMAIPVGSRNFQELFIITKKDGKKVIEKSSGCIFVPLVGKNGWN